MTAAGIVLAWALVVRITGVPPFILPGPLDVALVLAEQWATLLRHAAVTGGHIVVGLGVGVLLGGLTGLALAASTAVRRWLYPMLVISQALPVFALAPLLVLWFGYGAASKIAMAVLIVYFPLTSAFYDGLRRADPGLLDLARLAGANGAQRLVLIRLPSAMPAFASGLRVAAATAPIGAVVGEWVGASAGLGFLMLHANARMQVDLMFAALVVLAAMALALFTLVDRLGHRLTPWQSDSFDHLDPEEQTR
ncbi:MAG: ABC transporter permease [Pseudomonadota bacterium]